MKLSAQEEYGLRCLLRLAREGEGWSMTIPEIAFMEGLSTAYVAKLMRILRRWGYVRSARGKDGGYVLADPPEKIVVADVMFCLGGPFFDTYFCKHHAGEALICTNDIDCSMRSLWKALQRSVDQLLRRLTLKDLLSSEDEIASMVSGPAKPGRDFVPVSDLNRA